MATSDPLQDTEATENKRRGRPMLYVGLGFLIYILFQVGTSLIPRGVSEFAYLPNVSKTLLFSALYGFTFEQAIGRALEVVLGVPALLLVATGIGSFLRLRSLSPTVVRRAATVVAIASVVFVCWTVLGLYRGRALVDDELTYSVQAQLLSEGKLGFKRVPIAVLEPFLISAKPGITGKYLFGEPLIQILGVAFGYPALLHVLLTAFTFLFFYLMVSIRGDKQLACWAVILLACSPMLLLVSGNGQSQCSSLFCIVTAGLGYALIKTNRVWTGVLLLGAGIGMGISVRPQTVAPVGAVIVVAAVWNLLKGKRFIPTGVLTGVLAVFAIVLLWYNKSITGSYFTLPWYITEPAENYGFGPIYGDGGSIHTPLRALYNLLITLVRFNAWWLGWPSSLLLFVLWLIWGRPIAHGRVWLLAGVALIAFNFFYYSPGVSDAGPIYYYELLIPASILGANAIVSGLRTRPTWIVSLLVVHFGLGSTTFIFQETARTSRLIETIHAESDAAIRKIPRPAILFYETDCSERVTVGWVVSSFPRRCYADSCPVVTFPRPRTEALPLYRHAYPTRSCWYYHRNPTTLQSEVSACTQVGEVFNRPARNKSLCLMIASTAAKLGF
jgi:hypothetical protein